MSRIEAVDFGGEEDSIVVSGSADTTISLWDTKSSSSTKPIQTLTEATDTVSSLHAHMPTYSIASGSYDGRVRIYDLRMGRTTVDVLAHPITSVKCSVDGNAILVSSLDGRIRLLDRLDGKLLKAFPNDSAGGSNDDTRKDTKARYRNSSLRIRSVFARGDAVVLSGSESANLEPASAAAGVIPKSQSVSLTNADEKDQAHVFAWDILTGEVTATVPAGLGVKVVSCVAWNEKGKCWAAACADGKISCSYLIFLAIFPRFLSKRTTKILIRTIYLCYSLLSPDNGNGEIADDNYSSARRHRQSVQLTD
jgi:mitogen-activated protein kinase organizer 1